MTYYAGDYYAGDPGFLSLIGKGLSMFGGSVPVVGGALSKIGGALAKRAPTLMRGAKILGPPVLSGAGAAGIEYALSPRAAPGSLMPGMGLRGMPGGAIAPGMRGFHMSKPRKCGSMVIPSHLVRNRRMRVTNPKALHRAIRRASGFARLAKKVMRFTSPRPPKGRGYFKTRRRAKK